jgi:hypothetical protein
MSPAYRRKKFVRPIRQKDSDFSKSFHFHSLVDPISQLNQDRLIPQTILTLNLLRSSRIHPSLSALLPSLSYDLNRTPIAPPTSAKVVAHVGAIVLLLVSMDK